MDGAGGLDVVGWPVVAASLSLVALALLLGWALGLRIGRDVVVAVTPAALAPFWSGHGLVREEGC